MLNMEIGKIYTITTRVPALLGASVNNAKLVAILDHSSLPENLDAKARAVYPLLPEGTVDDPTLYVYYKFKAESGIYTILADQWIDSYIDVSNPRPGRILIANLTLDKMNSIRDVLNALNITDYEIKVDPIVEY